MRVPLANKPKNRFELIELSYQRLKQYGLHIHYILSACEVVQSAYKNKNRKSDPYFRRPFPQAGQPVLQTELSHSQDTNRAEALHFLTLSGSIYHRSFLA